MQPSDSNAPIPRGPAGSSPMPFSAAPQPNPALPPYPSEPPHRRSRPMRFLLAGMVIAAVVSAAAAITMVVISMQPRVKLTTYSTAAYSLEVPDGYQKDTSGSTVNFNEVDADATQSRVMVYYSAFEVPLPAEQVKSIRDTLRTQLGTAVEDLAKKGSQKLEDLKISEGKFHDQDALWLNASVSENDKPSGKVKLVAMIDSKRLYMIGVAAHAADKGLVQQTDAIIDSFKLK